MILGNFAPKTIYFFNFGHTYVGLQHIGGRHNNANANDNAKAAKVLNLVTKGQKGRFKPQVYFARLAVLWMSF
jgi:hypothetical protein